MAGIRAYADNVILKLDPLEMVSKGGITVLDQTRLSGHRFATVIASGPGHYRTKLVHGPGQRRDDKSDRTVHTAYCGFVPNETKPGDRVIIDKHAGQDYALDLSIPRHNKSVQFQELVGERGEFRIVREDEIAGIIEDEQAAVAAE